MKIRAAMSPNRGQITLDLCGFIDTETGADNGFILVPREMAFFCVTKRVYR